MATSTLIIKTIACSVQRTLSLDGRQTLSLSLVQVERRVILVLKDLLAHKDLLVTVRVKVLVASSSRGLPIFVS